MHVPTIGFLSEWCLVVQALPAPDDLRVLLAVVRQGSFAGAAQALSASPAYVSKRIRLLEAQLGLKLLHRTTRQVALTPEGQRICQRAQRVLEDMELLVQEAQLTRCVPRGLLRVSCSFGFGRHVVAPALAQLAQRYPQLQIRLEVLDRLVDIAAEGMDLDVRVGDEIAPHLIARKLADNHRVLCAAPAYVQRRGQPASVQALTAHDCLPIKERDHPLGTWQLQHADGQAQTVKVAGPLSTNHGEVATQWALQGLGIVLRSQWDVAGHLAAGRLVQVLPGWQQAANVWAVYPTRLERSAKVRVCVEFLQTYLAQSLAPVVGGNSF